MVLEVTGEWSSGVGAANELANATPSPSSPATAARCVLNCRVYVPRGGETIAIMKQKRCGFDEMEVVGMAYMFWRRTRHTYSKMDK
jgi:hypothetical protein